MNIKKTIAIILGLIALILICIAPVMAQDAPPAAPDAPPVVSPEVVSAVAPVVEGLAGKYGWVTQVLLVMASLRLVFKPVCEAVHAYVASTASTKDDEFEAKVENSKAFKIFAFILDWGGSIKLKK